MNNFLTRLGGGALGLNTSEDADLGSQNCGALGSKGSEDAVLGSRENGGISLKSSQGADFALENFNGASKTRHSETPKAGSESVTRA
ncbi:hypothetical protein IJ732_05265, partial [bacterium]|nr:hypothetical protein [bacterium]